MLVTTALSLSAGASLIDVRALLSLSDYIDPLNGEGTPGFLFPSYMSIGVNNSLSFSIDLSGLCGALSGGSIP